MSDVQKPGRVRRYAYVNNVRASRGVNKITVYVLLLNVADGVLPIPYHIGVSENLQLKLRRDQFVTWHFHTFGRPALVHVFGTVAEKQVAAVQTAMTDTLQVAGFKLMADAVGEQFLRGSTASVLRYARQQSLKTPFEQLPLPRGLVAERAVRRQKTSEPEQQADLASTAKVDVAQPVKLLRLRQFKPEGLSDEARELHALLVKNFDEAKQQAQIVVWREPGVDGEQADLELLATCVELRDIWRPWRMIPKTNRKMTFKLTNTMRATLLR